jgi:hypothetical protein
VKRNVSLRQASVQLMGPDVVLQSDGVSWIVYGIGGHTSASGWVSRLTSPLRSDHVVWNEGISEMLPALMTQGDECRLEVHANSMDAAMAMSCEMGIPGNHFLSAMK